MIPIFNDSGDRLSMTYGGLTLNNDADSPDSTYEVNSVTMMAPVTAPQETRPDRDGSEIYDARKTLFVFRIDLTIRAQSLAALFDKIVALQAAFDPAKAAHEDTSGTYGFSAFDFSVPTADTVTYPTGLVASRYYARARQTPVPASSEYTGFAAFLTIEMLVADPRRYAQSASTLSGAGTAANAGNYPTYPTLTITATGAGSATYQVANDPALAGIASSSLVLNLSGLVNTDVVTVDMASKTIEKNGVEAPSLYVSGSFFALERGNNAITYTNTTNVTSSLSWRSAWVV